MRRRWGACYTREMRQFLLPMLVLVAACDGDKSKTGASPSGEAIGRPDGVEVVRSSAPATTEEALMSAIDDRLDVTFAQIGKRSFRSKMELAATLSDKLQPRAILHDIHKTMGTTDVAVLSLFAKQPDVRARVGAHVKKRADEHTKKLEGRHGELPVVVRQDCVDAVTQKLAMQLPADAGAPRARPGAMPLVGAVFQECKKASETEGALKCVLEAADLDALQACP